MDKLQLPGELSSLGAIRDYARSAATAAGIDKSAIYRLSLAVDEIASNIVIHGYDEAGLRGDVIVWAEIDADVLKLHIEDTGASYDVSQYRNPDNLHRPFAERTEGGLGVYLATQGVDRLSYASEGGRNRHTFEVDLTRSAAPVL